MSDVVPPGGDRPVDDVPWPVESPPPTARVRVPGVPADLPSGVVAPQDWRTIDEDGPVPPGYRVADGRSSGGAVRLDRFGLAACIVGVLGLLQLFVVAIPFLALLSLSLGLSGRRYVRLDPDGYRSSAMSTIGVALGAAGLVAGVALTLAEFA